MNKNKHEIGLSQDKKILEQAAEAWARLCLYHLQQKKQLSNQNNNQKVYEHNK